jgi:WD40 repeat protein
MRYGESCVRVWDVESGKERLADAGHRTAATLSLSADGGTLISEGTDGRIIHWDLRSGNAEVRPPVKQTDKREEIGSRAYEPNSRWENFSMLGRRWRLTYKGQLEELEARSLDGSKLLGKLKVPAPAMRAQFALSPDGNYLACAFNEAGDPIRPWHVLVWDPEREKEPRRFGSGPRGSACGSLQFTHDGKRLIVGVNPTNPNRSETIWICDVAAAKIVRKLPTLSSSNGMILTGDDRLLITSDDMGRVWDLETGKELARFSRKCSIWPSFQFLSPDERFLASVAGESLTVWETSSWKPIRSFALPASPNSMVFSRDGRSLFVANNDSTMLEWDVSGRFGRKTKTPNRDRLNVLWRTLAETPDKAYPAVWELLDHPAEAVPFLIGKLAPVKPVEESRIRPLLARLDS